MRRAIVLITLLLLLAACEFNGDDTPPEILDPTPTPTIVVEPTPEPTPTAVEEEPTPEEVATPTEVPDVPDEQEAIDLEAFVDQVAANVVELRGLELLEDLTFEIMTRQELRVLLEDELELEQIDIDALWIFRLIDDREIDLEQMLIDVQAADIYGFYDPEEQATYVIAEDEDLGAMEEVFLAHEITHALQDQHFDLGQLEALEPDYDAAMVFLAVMEGDAVLTQQLYAQRYLDEERQFEFLRELMTAALEQERTGTFENLPRYILESLYFPYEAGPQFIMQLFDGGYESINAVLANPPSSTQQLMNPSAYLAGEIDDPVEIDMPDLHDRLGEGWTLFDEGTFGVFDLTIMLEVNGVTETEAALAEWRGSATSVYENGDDIVGVLVTRWASEDGAAAFENALIQTMNGYAEEDGVWIGEGRYHVITVEGDAVVLTSSSSPDALLDAVDMQ